MKVYFLTEFSSTIGYGHITRCSSLAEEFVRRGNQVKFIIRGDGSEPNLEFDFELIEWNSYSFIQKINIDGAMLVFDSYIVSKKELYEISRDVNYPISIADSQENYIERGLIISPTAYGKELICTIGQFSVDVLAGPEFVLFRNEFSSSLPIRKKRNEKVSKVLVSLGGFINVDMLKVITQALKMYFEDLNIYVIGQNSRSYFEDDKNIKLLDFIDIKKYISILQKVDFAILNGGQSLNEAILLKVPVIAIPVAKNQLRNLNYWHNKGVCLACEYNSLSNLKVSLINNLMRIEKYQVRENLQSVETNLDRFASRRIVDFLHNKIN